MENFNETKFKVKNEKRKIMIEEKVKEVFLTYLKNKGEYSRPKSIHSRGADSIIKGKAYEMKGSKFDQKRAIRQLISYNFDYERISLVLPSDALTLTFIYQLKAIERFLNCSIEIYLVTQRENGNYFIHKFSSAGLLENQIGTILYELSKNEIVNLASDEKEKKVKDYTLNLEEKLKEEIKKFMIQKGEIIFL